MSVLDRDSLSTYCFSRAPGKISSEIDGHTVIMDIQGGTYFSLNPVGRVVWNAMEQSVDFSTILNNVLEYFDVGAEQASNDIVAFLERLIQKDLISADRLE